MSGRASDRPRDPRAGYSLVELVIAVVILAVGILGLAGATSWAVRQVNVADLRTQRAAAVQSALEQMKAADFDALLQGNEDPSDSVTVHPFRIIWDTDSLNYNLAEVEVVTVGPGYRAQPGEMPILVSDKADTFYFRIARP